MKEGRVIWRILLLGLLGMLLKIGSRVLIGYGCLLLAKTYLNPTGIRAVTYILIGGILWFAWLKDTKIGKTKAEGKKEEQNPLLPGKTRSILSLFCFMTFSALQTAKGQEKAALADFDHNVCCSGQAGDQMGRRVRLGIIKTGRIPVTIRESAARSSEVYFQSTPPFRSPYRLLQSR